MGRCLEPAVMIICMSWLAWHPFLRHVLINKKLASGTLSKRTFSILSMQSCAPKNTYKPPDPNQDMFIPSWTTWALVSGVGVMFLGTWPYFFFYFPTFLSFSWLLCTYRVTWPSLLAGNPIVPLFWTPLLFSSLGKSVTPIVHDSIVLWPLLFVMAIVPSFCMLSQVAALMYISWTYSLELGLKPDLVCNSLVFWVLVAWSTISLLSFFEFVFRVLKTLPIPLYLHPDIGLSNPFAFITFQNTLSY